MLAYTFLAVALLCAGGLAQDPNYDLYLGKCKEIYPYATEMEVYLYQEFFSSYWCYGSNDTTSYIGGVHYKGDGVPCKFLGGLEKTSHQWLNQTCRRDEDVQECRKQHLVGELKAMDVEGCELTCYARKSTSIMKEEGTFCNPKGRDWQPGKCTASGMCDEERTYVQSPKPRTPPNQDMIEEICKNELPEYVLAAPLYYAQNGKTNMCEFACIQATSDDWILKIPALNNHTICDDEWECIGGLCTDPRDIMACNHHLNEPLERVDYDGCEMKCKGTQNEESIFMKPGHDCIHVGEYGVQSAGTCNSQLECVEKK